MTEPVTFVKGDQTRVAVSAREAVQLRYDGWQPQRSQPAPAPVVDPQPELRSTLDETPPAVDGTPAAD